MSQEITRINPETGQPYPTQKEKLDEITAKIEQGIKDVFNSENYKNYLLVMSKFHKYSVNNQMLIYLQNPSATKVATFKKWKEKFDRHVMRGEKGIKIIAPAPYKKTVSVEKIDPETRLPILDSEGNPITIQKEIVMPGFKAVTVFDVSQTDGRPLPELVHSLKGKVKNYEYLKEAIQKSAPVPIKFKELKDNLDGYFSVKEQSITIREGMSEPQTLCAMVHEIAHSVLHNPQISDEKKARKNEEVEAESVAYAVCKYFGIDTDENSFGYLAAWSSGKEVKELRESLDIINMTANTLISNIDDRYKEIIAEREMVPAEVLNEKICSFLQGSRKYLYDETTPQTILSHLVTGDIKYISGIFQYIMPKPKDISPDDIVTEGDKSQAELLLEELKIYEKRNFNEGVYKVGDKAFIEVHRLEDGYNWDFSIFDPDSLKLSDGGFTDFDENDELAQLPLFDLVKEIAADFNLESDDISIADESVVSEIEKINKIESVAEIEARFLDKENIHPPCPELTQETLDKFGYTYDGMYPITKETAVELMQNFCDVYVLHNDGTESVANTEEEILNHYGMLGVEKTTWEKTAVKYEEQKALNEKEKVFLENEGDSFAIYQLKPVSSNDNILFMNSKYLETEGIPIDYARYSFRYSDLLLTDDRPKAEILEGIYEDFNFHKPKDFTSRSVSVSDILVLRQSGELTYHYVDSIGFKEVPNFIPIENYLKNAELQIEDDAGMIDGIINNGKREVSEVNKEYKESVLKKLEEAKERIAVETNPIKPKERTIDHDQF